MTSGPVFSHSLRRAAMVAAALAAVVWGTGNPVYGQTTAGTNALVWAVSVSRQFHAYAHHPVLPSVLTVVAERVKRDWLDALGTSDAWRDPIIILVQAREGPLLQAAPMSLEVIPTDLHLKYQIRCVVPPALTQSALAPAVIEALCAETAHRTLAVTGARRSRFQAVPPWLVTGLAQSIQGRSEQLRAVARRSLAGGRPQSAVDLLQAIALPAGLQERELFEANAWLLVESLLGLNSGPAKLLRTLAVLDAAGSATNAFWEVYRADFPKTVDLEKWWSVQLAARTAVMAARNLTAAETTQRLDRILTTDLSLGTGGTNPVVNTSVSLDKLVPYYRQPWVKSALQNKLAALDALRSEAHPSYRDALALYGQAIQFLLTEKVRQFPGLLKKADAARQHTDQTARRISDYLDESERVYAPQDWNVTFRDYFQILEQFQLLDEQRRSTFSDYLDKFDR